jgi:hemerythrin
MALINWSPKLSVGVFQLDADHVILIGLINQLYDAMSEGHGQQLTKTILATLKEYTFFHFSREESLMKKQKYPNYEDHKGYHERLINQLNDFMARHAADNTSVTPPEIAQFLQGWLINHIQKADFAYKPFMPAEVGFTDC